MTVLDDRPTTDVSDADAVGTALAPDHSAEPDLEPEVSATRVALVGALSSIAAGIVLGGLFQGSLGRIVGALAAVVGAGIVGLGLRSNRTFVQYLAAPAVFIGGYAAALVLPNATGVHGTVPQLIRQAISNGGLAHPPVPFDPGWRFLLVGLVGLVAAAAVSLAGSFGKPRLAILVPLPLIAAGALNQPKGHELLGGAIALGLLLVALSLSYGAELAGSAEVSRRFEVRQLGTSLVATVAVLGLLAALSRASVLFPQPAQSNAAKPQKPRIVPLSQIKDKPLFDAPAPGPWQVGAFTVFDKGEWLLPPFDEHGTAALPDGGKVPDAPTGPTSTYSITVRQIGGFTLPTPPEPVSVGQTTVRIGYDPARSVLRTRDGAAADGLHYTVTARTLPSGDELASAAQKVPPATMKAYLDAPDQPAEITQLLTKAPSSNRWDRLQLLRKALYDHVVAKGNGIPVPITAAKVIEEIHGGSASPFEIVGAEAVLARWVGLPSRIGYGYYDQSKSRGGTFRPADGANWLEVWFDGYGWVPILGTPLKAQSDLNAVKKTQQQIKPASEQTLQIYVPVLTRDPALAFQIARYWAERTVPLLLALWVLWRLVPVPARALRRRRRRAWANAHGPAGRIAAAYAGFRDSACDLGLDDGRSTPLEFLSRVDDDLEHRELAWLTTRALWGDLARDLRADDAEAAEALARSLSSRMARAQSGLTRLGAVSSRASLRNPWDAGLPNVWPHRRVRLPRLPRRILPRRLRTLARKVRVA